MKIYDLVIVGCGISGIMVAQSIRKKNFSILIVDKGKCATARKSLIHGWLGRGLYQFDKLDLKDQSHKIFSIFKKILEVKKLKEDLNFNFGNKLSSYLLDMPKNTHVLFNTEINNINTENSLLILSSDKKKFVAKRCIVATGKYSAKWLSSTDIKTNDIKSTIGIRIETSSQPYNYARHNFYVGEWEEYNVLSSGFCIINKKSNRMSFTIEKTTNIDEVLRIAKIINILSNDKIRTEKVSDFLNSKTVFKKFDFFTYFHKQLNEIANQIDLSNANVYMPEVTIEGNAIIKDFRTNIPNLYCIGECVESITNLTNAMISGVEVAKTILKE